MDDPHDEARRLGLILAEGEAHKLLSEALHLAGREPRELVAVGVDQRGTAVGLLLDVNEVAELKAGQAWHWRAVERRAVAQPVPDRGGDGGRGVGRKRRVRLVLVLVLHCCGVVQQSTAAVVDAIVRIYPGEKVGQGQMHSRAHRLTGSVVHFGAAVPLFHSLAVFVLFFLLFLELLQQEVLL